MQTNMEINTKYEETLTPTSAEVQGLVATSRSYTPHLYSTVHYSTLQYSTRRTCPSEECWSCSRWSPSSSPPCCSGTACPVAPSPCTHRPPDPCRSANIFGIYFSAGELLPTSGSVMSGSPRQWQVLACSSSVRHTGHTKSAGIS